jgi:hypothetical protein
MGWYNPDLMIAAKNIKQQDLHWEYCLAPLYQQVISWFLERKVWINIFAIDNWNSWTFDIVMEDIMKPFYVCFDGKELEFSSYEEAREAAILKAIEEYRNLSSQK